MKEKKKKRRDRDEVKQKRKQREARMERNEELTLEERQKQRKGRRASKRRRFFATLITVLVLTALIGGTIYAHTHDLLNIEVIEVSGNEYYETQEIVKMAGAETGGRILTTKTQPYEDALLDEPYIKTVKVSRRLPHTLKIEVVERKESFAASLAGAYVILDDEKYALRRANTADEFVIIEGFVPKELFTIGQPYAVENQAYFDEVVEVAELVEDYGMDVKKITFQEGLVKVYFTDLLLCKASSENFIKYIDYIYEAIEKQKEAGVERGTIHVGDDAYIAFSPILE